MDTCLLQINMEPKIKSVIFVTETISIELTRVNPDRNKYFQ